jgi:hypothetical protein
VLADIDNDMTFINKHAFLERNVAFAFGSGRYKIITASQEEETDNTLLFKSVLNKLRAYDCAMCILKWDRDTVNISNSLVSFNYSSGKT